MQIIVALAVLAFTVFVALTVLMSFNATRNAAGLGAIQPTGVPGWVASKIGTKTQAAA